jgi:hypothetical protein
MMLKNWLMLAAAAGLLAMITNRRPDGGIAVGVKRALANDGPEDECAVLGSVPDIGRQMSANTLSPALNPLAGLARLGRSEDQHRPVTMRSPIAQGN